MKTYFFIPMLASNITNPIIAVAAIIILVGSAIYIHKNF